MGRLLILLCLIPVLSVSGQTHLLPGETDWLRINLEPPAPITSPESVTLAANNDCTNAWDGALTEAFYINGNGRYSFSSLMTDSNDSINQMVKDSRPYNGYTIDWPLTINLHTAGRYQMNFRFFPNDDKAAAVMRLIDNKYPDLFIMMENHEKEGNYSFDVAKDETGVAEGRFSVRFYAACLFKKGTDGNWNNADNWYGGIPGAGSTDKVNNAAIIPEGVTVTVLAGESYSIGSLLNSGTVVIKDNASLEITHEAKMASVSDLY